MSEKEGSWDRQATGSNQDRAESEDGLRLLLRDGSGRWGQGGAEACDSVRERLSPRKTTGATRAAQGRGKGGLTSTELAHRGPGGDRFEGPRVREWKRHS